MATCNPWFMSYPCKIPKEKPCYKLVSYRKFSLDFQRAAIISSNEVCSPNIVRGSTDFDFHPSVWGDHFISTFSTDLKQNSCSEHRLEELKKEIKDMLNANFKKPLEQINLIDKIQRLGVAYQFETEIENVLKRINNVPFDCIENNYDLYDTALRFRLLRQAGYDVLSDVFKKFKDEKGDFHAKLSMDVEGMLSLYEAAHLSFNGEDILEEAIDFTTKHLKLFLSHANYTHLAKQVRHALELPLHKRFTRLEASHYIYMYQEDESRIGSLLEFAKLDFNMVQKLHQREISEISRWWRDIDIVSKLPYSPRDRLVEGYAMIMAIFFQPQYSVGRIYMAKLFAMLTVIDDTYDTYGTLEELEPLTRAILRWDMEAMDDLPESMKLIFQELFNLCNEFQEMTRRDQSHIFSYLKQEIKNYARSSLEDAKLFSTRQVPTLEEWFQVALVTCGVSLLVVSAMMDMGDSITKHDLDWVTNEPKMISTCAVIVRLIDDIRSFKSEQERGNAASSVACYMKEHGVSEVEAIEDLQSLIKNTWKEMNQECLRPTPVPMPILTNILNIARLMEVFYLYGDGYTDTRGHTKQIIASLYINVIPMSRD